MSRLEREGQQFHVVLPSVRNLPPNPHIGPWEDALARAVAPPSETEETDSECQPELRIDKALRYWLLACDQRCFLTGSAAADLQGAHLLNPIRKNDLRRIDVEKYLSQLCFQPPESFRYLLDSPENEILLTSSLHRQWCFYGTFCIVPAEKDAQDMLSSLCVSNAVWTKNSRINQHAARPVNISESPYNTPAWDVVVLHPNALLPEGQALAIAKDRFYHVRGQSAPPTSQLTWTYWTASGDRLISNSNPHEPLAPFIVENVRDVYKNNGRSPVCSFAMVVNAHSKLQHFVRNHGSPVSPRVQRYTDLMSDLVHEIFFVPKKCFNDAEPKNTMEGALRIKNAKAAKSLGPVEATELSSGGGNAAEPAEIPDEDGLTDTEFRLVSERACDPHLDPGERADAAMLMMFGTRRYEDPYSQGSPIIQRD